MNEFRPNPKETCPVCGQLSDRTRFGLTPEMTVCWGCWQNRRADCLAVIEGLPPVEIGPDGGEAVFVVDATIAAPTALKKRKGVVR